MARVVFAFLHFYVPALLCFGFAFVFAFIELASLLLRSCQAVSVGLCVPFNLLAVSGERHD